MKPIFVLLFITLSLTFSGCDDYGARTIERTGKPTLTYPMGVFDNEELPTWSPGEDLPLSLNKAYDIADDWVRINFPEQTDTYRYSEKLTLMHIKDRHWAYDYSVWLGSKTGFQSTPVNVSILLDGSIWEPEMKKNSLLPLEM